MRTYVRMIFQSEGSSPQEVLRVMQQMKFEESMGIHDFVFKWTKQPSFEEVLELVTTMHGRLKGLGVNYEVTTIA
ncbi:MAG TPA: hypothetical protein VKT21_01200 [Thermoplasmata archaeon]|nr:hypothetical protein [Thermoplasmata archaeon]